MSNIVQFKDKESNAYVKINLRYKTILERKELFPNEPFKSIDVVEYNKKYKNYTRLEEIASMQGWLTRYNT